MKDKNVAGILALFLGWVGVHRFYLGQIGWGIVYILLLGTGISFLLGLIDAIAFFVMDQDRFDLKYNRKEVELRRTPRRNTDFDRDRRRSSRPMPRRTETPSHRRPVKRMNPYKQKGVERYKDFDYIGAIEEFLLALEVEERDVAVHFNLACAYSLEEEAEKSFYHLDKAVEYGFTDFKRIKEHDALAYLRIQDGFEAFETNGFRMQGTTPMPAKNPQLEAPGEDDLLSTSPDLLDQIKKLGDLRDKGLLTEKEFAEQKRRLMG